jgi:hypothetical protein
MHNLNVWEMALRKEREVEPRRYERESRIQQELARRGPRPVRWPGRGVVGRLWRGASDGAGVRWRRPEIPRRAGEAGVGTMALAECHEG